MQGLRRINPIEYIHLAGNEKEKHSPNLIEVFEVTEPKKVPKEIIEKAKELYEYLFPSVDERTPWEGVIKVLNINNSGYHLVLGLSKNQPVSFSLFKSLPFSTDKMIAYMLYGGHADSEFMKKAFSRDENFRGIGLEATRILVTHGIVEEDSKRLKLNGVVGSIGESEFIGQGKTPEEIRYTKTRLIIHQHNGFLPVMLVGKKGELLSPLIQPKLSEESHSLMLHLLFRPLKMETSLDIKEIDKEFVRELMRSYLYNFKNYKIEPIKKIIEKRIEESVKAVLVPPEKLPNLIELAKHDPLLKEQVERDFGSLEEQKKKILEALS